MEVRFRDAEKVNLMGYFLRDLLRTNLKTRAGQTAAQALRGAFLFEASGMKTRLIFSGQSIEVASGNDLKYHAKIKGDLNTLLDIALGNHYLKFIFTGKIRISGNFFLLLKLMKVLRAN
ncbi:MAG: SCP2 sterol-binding domain-containing protein [bacterium]